MVTQVDSPHLVLPEGGLVVKVLYNNRLCEVVETSSDVTLAEHGRQFTVSFGDEGLVFNPTDKQVADAENLGEWYGLDEVGAQDFRAMLRRH